MKRFLQHLPELIVVVGLSLFTYAIVWTVLDARYEERKAECLEAAKLYSRHCDKSPEVCDTKIKAVYDLCMESE